MLFEKIRIEAIGGLLPNHIATPAGTMAMAPIAAVAGVKYPTPEKAAVARCLCK